MTNAPIVTGREIVLSTFGAVRSCATAQLRLRSQTCPFAFALADVGAAPRAAWGRALPAAETMISRFLHPAKHFPPLLKGERARLLGKILRFVEDLAFQACVIRSL